MLHSWTALLGLAAALAAACKIAALIEPFELSDVTLSSDSVQARASSLNMEYLFQLDPDRLLWTFRNNAGLPTPKRPYLGTWEAPSCEVRGQFMGHYLSALSLVWLSTGNVTARERISYLVNELRVVQRTLGRGYLSAYPSEHFDRLEGLQQVWAPYYVIHKLMAGLLDAHLLAENPHGLDMVEDMAEYFLSRIDRTLGLNGTAHWEAMLEVEFGGMNDVMYRLYSLTRKPDHLRMAHLFDKPRFYRALVAGQDPLPGLHANTHLAQVVGFASRYEVVHDSEAGAATANFYETVQAHHAYATGGSSDNEGWGPPDRLADAIVSQGAALNTEETCTQYNILKVARSLFRWSGDLRLADFYERAITNGILGVARMPAHGQHHDHASHEHDHTEGGSTHDGNHNPASHNSAAFGSSGTDHPAAAGGAAANSGSMVAHGVGDGHSIHAKTRRLATHQRNWDTLSSNAEQVGRIGARHNQEASVHSAYIPISNDHAVYAAAPAGAAAALVGLSTGTQPLGTATAAKNNSPSSSTSSGTQHGGAGTRGSQGNVSGSGSRLAVWRRRPDNAGFDDRAVPPANASNAPGPGVYLYLLPLGAGQAKGDNFHGWGYPFDSFWCCYGTAVESFAKLADSIYFKTPGRMEGTGHDMSVAAESAPPRPAMIISAASSSAHATEPWLAAAMPAGSATAAVRGPPAAGLIAVAPQLYVNQLVSSTVRWREMGVQVQMTADLYAPGGRAIAELSVTTEAHRPKLFTLMLRIPAWANASDRASNAASGSIVVDVNGDAYKSCPGAPAPGQYCQISRSWMSMDTVRVALPMAWWLDKLPDDRPEYAGLHALMLGPFLMAGLTHDTRLLSMDAQSLPQHTREPAIDQQALVSVQAAWDPAVHMRHDRYHLQTSAIDDNGDAIDATFQSSMASGCPHGGALPSGNSSGSNGGNGPSAAAGLSDVPARCVTLEALSFPGFFMVHDGDGNMVLQQGRTGGGAGGGGHGAPPNSTFWVRPGLSQEPGTTSLESVVRLGHYVSAFLGTQPPCRDYLPDCRRRLAQDPEMCSLQPDMARVQCRSTCSTCGAARSAIRLQPLQPGSTAFATASSWRLAAPLTPHLPPGAKIVSGTNRQYLLVPLGNIVDERYTAYFDVQPPRDQLAQGQPGQDTQQAAAGGWWRGLLGSKKASTRTARVSETSL